MSLTRANSILLVMALALTGCSNQWRRADLGMNAGGVFSVLEEIETGVQPMATGGDKQHFFALRYTPGMSVYFADGPSPLGPVISVLSLADFGFLGAEMASLYYEDIASVRVAYIEVPGQDCALLVDIGLAAGGYNTQYYSCDGAPYIQDDEYVAVLSGGSGKIALRSNDVDNKGNLRGVIQLRISVVDAAGNDAPVGKFSTLVGFGP